MNSDTWVEKMHLEDKTGYQVGFPKSIGFVPVSEEVLFIEPAPNAWLDGFLARRADEIDAMFARRKYHLVGYNLDKVFFDKKWVAAYARVQALIEKKKNDAVYEKMAAENPSVRRLKEVLSGEDKDSIDESNK